MTERRRPAQTSRIVAAGLSTATMLGIVAVLARPPSAEPPATFSLPAATQAVTAPHETGAPPRVAARPGAGSSGRRSLPVTTTGPS